MTKRIKVYVIDQTEGGKSIKCAPNDEMEDIFHLAKSQITPIGKVRKMSFCEFDATDFIYLSHWQLCGREAYDAEKAKRRARKQGAR